MAVTSGAPKSMMQRFLDTVEQVGNRVPHPVIIFLILIGFVIVLSFILEATGASVTYQVINPETHAIETVTTQARSLATASGIRDMYVRLVPNFMVSTTLVVSSTVIPVNRMKELESCGSVSAQYSRSAMTPSLSPASERASAGS